MISASDLTQELLRLGEAHRGIQLSATAVRCLLPARLPKRIEQLTPRILRLRRFERHPPARIITYIM